MAMNAEPGSQHLSIVENSEWDTLREAFLAQCRADLLKESAIKYYRCRTTLFTRWVIANKIGLDEFRGRHMSSYIAQRRAAPGRAAGGSMSFQTLTHDGKAVRRMFRFAVEADFLEQDPLRDYKVKSAPDGNVYCPSADEVRKLLQTVKARWDPVKNEKAGFVPRSERNFYEALHTAIIGGLVATGARINELLSLRLDDYQADRMQIYIPAAKNGEDRFVPFKEGWLTLVEAWRRKRPRTKSPTLFVNQYGGQIDPASFGLVFRRYRALAGLERVTIHSLRHYAVSQLAKVDVLMAANAAGHKSLEVTRGYIHKDADHIREKYDEADPLGKVMINKRTERQAEAKRKKVIGK